MLSPITEENIPGKIVMISNLTAMVLQLVEKKYVSAGPAQSTCGGSPTGHWPDWVTTNKLAVSE
jgi:hypothetical protein